MKKAVLFAVALYTSTLLAQEKPVTFGLKAGLNYGDNGKIEVNDITTIEPNDEIGYHLGVFLKGKLTNNLYIKPELQYTVNNSSYTSDGDDLDYSIKKLDVPILIGTSLLGPIHIFGGPSLQYMIENDLEDVDLGDVMNEFTVGLQFGVGVQLDRINIDIRYERGLTKNQAESISDDIRVDTRPNQLILSLGLEL